jgi:hypothetical protein
MALPFPALYGPIIGLLIFLIMVWIWPAIFFLGSKRDRARAERLARRMEARAGVRRADGSRGLRARRALRILARRARRYDSRAEGALWRVWLACPDGQVWDLLEGSAYHRRAFAVATDPAQPEATRSAVGAFFAARGLAPEEAGQRALFFVLTGQRAQHRTEDPDGALLAAAYRAARQEQRAAVRQALAGADDLDLVRVIAGAGRDAMAAVTAEEASYLAGQLAGQRDWAGLWQLALGLPLADAVTAASRIGDGWQPGDPAGQALLQQLATADARQITLAISGGGRVADRHPRTGTRSSDSPRGGTQSRRPPPGWLHAAEELLRRPLALLTPADLDTVAGLLPEWPTRPLELLADCLEYRFGTEIALEAQMPITPGSTDDVAISPSPVPRPPAQA